MLSLERSTCASTAAAHNSITAPSWNRPPISTNDDPLMLSESRHSVSSSALARPKPYNGDRFSERQSQAGRSLPACCSRSISLSASRASRIRGHCASPIRNSSSKNRTEDRIGEAQLCAESNVNDWTSARPFKGPPNFRASLQRTLLFRCSEIVVTKDWHSAPAKPHSSAANDSCVAGPEISAPSIPC
jgi:hypothetical protein